MTERRQVARDLSYANSAQTKSGRAKIRFLENSTGCHRLIQRANGYEQDLAAGAKFWHVMATRYGLTLNVVEGALSNIPTKGPMILTANHPYGIFDGLMLGYILAQTRSDFRILANRVFQGAKELNKTLLPISFDAGRAVQLAFSLVEPLAQPRSFWPTRWILASAVSRPG